MSNNWYPLSVLTGGGAGALDSLDGDALVDGDRAVVISTTLVYHYELDATSGAAESSPGVIAPDTNPGTKRWLLRDVILPEMFAYDGTALTVKPTATGSKSISFGENNSVNGTGTGSAILSGSGNDITNGDLCVIPGGDRHLIDDSDNAVICGGDRNIIDTADDSGIVAGYTNQIDTGDTNFIGSGYSNLITASDDSAITSGSDNTIISSDYSIIGSGDDNSIDSSSRTSILGGDLNDIDTADYATIVGGATNAITSGAEKSIIAGGELNSVSSVYGCIPGGYYGSSYIQGQESFSAGRFAATGDSQRSILQVMIETTDATPGVLRVNATGSIHLVLPASRSWSFNISAVARQTAGAAGTVGDTAFWTITGGIKRDGSNNTALVGTPQGHGTPGANYSIIGAAAWDLTITADDTNEALLLTATGEASKTIHWAAKIELVEVG